MKTWKQLTAAKKAFASKEMYMYKGKLVDLEASTYRFITNSNHGLDFVSVVFFDVVEVETVMAPVSTTATAEDVDMIAMLIGV